MKTGQGYVQGYNGQVVVSKDQVIPGAEITREENDLHQLEPMLRETKTSLDEAGIKKNIGSCTTDNGYWRDDLPIQSIEANGPGLFIAVPKDSKQREQCVNDEHSLGRIPAQASPLGHMGRKLRTKRGKAKVHHGQEELLHQRLFAIAMGYEDGNDHKSLRFDAGLKTAVGSLPETGPALASQPTLSRFEKRMGNCELCRLSDALMDAYHQNLFA